LELIEEKVLEDLKQRFEGETAEAVLKWALNRFHPKIALASSFNLNSIRTLSSLTSLTCSMLRMISVTFHPPLYL